MFILHKNKHTKNQLFLKAIKTNKHHKKQPHNSKNKVIKKQL